MDSFYSAAYKYLAVYPDTEPDMMMTLTLKSIEGAVTKQCRRRACVVFSLSKNTSYTLSAEGGTVATAYLFSDDDENAGVSFLEDMTETAKTGELHFSPQKLPILSVSSAFFYRGTYHLCYLSSPFGDGKENTYLCHAVTCDLLRWKQLPVLLEPPEALCLVRHRTGGVFGGCAEIADEKVRLYFTRRIEDSISGETLFAYQSAVESRDMMHLSPEETVIQEAPPKATELSDPFVFSEKGAKYMVLGGTLSEKGACFLYRETEAGWAYRGPLFKNTLSKKIGFPSCCRLGRTFVALASLQGFVDADGTISPSYLLCGSFSEEKFKIKRRTRLDFGGDFYAPRVFSDGTRTLLFGAADQKGGVLLQRELSRKKGQFYVKPITEIYSLLGETVYAGRGEAVSFVPDVSAYYVKLSFCGKTPFCITLGKNGEETISITGDGEVCGFLMESPDGIKRYDAAMAPEKIEIFTDAEIIEVFLDGGKAAGTKRFLRTENIFRAEFRDETKVEDLVIREVLPPQNRFS